MDVNSGIIIVFLILFIQSGLSQRHSSFGYLSTSTGTNAQGLGSSFDSSQYNNQFGFTGNNRKGENRRISDSSSSHSGLTFGGSKAEDNNRKIPSSGINNNKQWNSGSDWNSDSQTGWSNSGYQSGSNTNQNGNSDFKNNPGNVGSSSGWDSDNEREEQISSGQMSTGQSDQKGNQRKTNSNRPGGYNGGIGSDSNFNFQNENTKKISGSAGSLSGSLFGSNSRKPQGSSSASSSSWGPSFNSNSKRPQENSGNSNWYSGSQNGDRETDGFGEFGFSSSNEEKNQEKSKQNGWNFGSGDTGRRPQGSSIIGGGSSPVSFSGSNKPQGSSIDWGSGINSNSKIPQGGSVSNSNSHLSFGFDPELKKPQRSSGNSDFSFTSESDWRRPEGSSGSSNWGMNSNSETKKPQGSSTTGSGYSQTNRPQGNQQKPNSYPSSRPSSDSREPPKKQSGNTTTQTDKATGNGKGTENQNGNPNQKKPEPTDWINLERENQQGPITFDFSELWHADDKKDPAWRSIWTRNRFRREIDTSIETQEISPDCHCADYQTCLPENRMDVNKFSQNYHRELRVKIMECAFAKKICCITTYHLDESTSPVCGKRISKLSENINNDDTANYGDHPWVLQLVTVGGPQEETLCSASLIHNSIALTTASCALLLIGKEVRVRSGEWNVVGGHDKNKIEETTIGKVIFHPDFDVFSYTKDFALLFLDTPFHYNRGSNIVCLPTHHDTWDANKCMIVGWMRKNEGLKSAMLKQVNVEIVAQGKCLNKDGLENELSDFEEPGFLCAQTQKDDPYLGDIGASLLCPLYNSNAVVQIGFVSNATQTNRKMSTFTNILDSLDWVYRMVDLHTFITGQSSKE